MMVESKQTETLPNGVKTTYSYDNMNRLTSVAEATTTQTLYTASYTLNPDGTRASATESQRQTDGSVTHTETDWSYDALDRLKEEKLTNVDANTVTYDDTFTYDLVGNRLGQTHMAGGTTDITTYSYTGDDQLHVQVDSVSGTTTFSYDANGSQTGSINGSTVTTFTYDVRNKMATYVAGGVTTTYVFDDAGNRVSENIGGATTLYLTNTNNPTGYAQPMEQRASAGAAPTTTYIIGDRVQGQANSAGTVSYLLIDGHGSTRLMTSSTGTVTAAFNYNAFGDAVGTGFSLATAPTVFLFGGDAVYDPASGLYLHGDGVRGSQGFRFVQADIQNNGSNSDPISLHKYLYANANPINGSDPTGHFDLVELLVTTGIDVSQFAIRIAPVARIAFAAVDAITASEIIYKGINEGFDKVTPLEWATLGISAIGAITAVPGTNLLVKAALSAFLHVPLGPALATFNGARLAIGQLAKLEQITNDAADAKRVGQFLVDSAGNPIIRYFRTGNDLEDATTLLHELFHYAEWVARGKPAYSALLAATTGPLEEAAEVVAKLVIKLVQA